MPIECRVIDPSRTVVGIMADVFKGSSDHGSKFARMLDKEIKANPKDPLPYAKKAMLLQKDMGAALAAVEEGLRNAGEDPLLYHARAMSYEMAGKREMAIAAFKDALRADPVFFESMMSLATLLNRSDKHKEALTYWNRIIELESDSQIGWFGKARSEYWLKDHENALKHIDAALFFTEDKKRTDIFLIAALRSNAKESRKNYLASRAIILNALGRHEEARADLTEAYALGRSRETLNDLSNLAKEEHDRGNRKESARYLAKILELDPTAGGRLELYRVVAIMYAENGMKEMVAPLFEMGIKRSGDRKKLTELGAQILGEIGELDESVKLYDRLYQKDRFVGYLINILQFCMAMKRDDVAKRYVDEIGRNGGARALLAFLLAYPATANAGKDFIDGIVRYYTSLSGESPDVLKASALERRANTVQPKKPKNVGRNDPCPCGSGKKFKKCCGG